jgi:tetratricopeptide (TPR) repeat protein
VVHAIPPFEYYSPVALLTMVRFSRWDDALREPAPPPELRYTTGIWHYARGLAFAAKGRLDSAAVEHDSVVAIAARIPAEQLANLNSARTLVRIAERHLAAELAARHERTDDAVRALHEGIALEDELTYDEPTAWVIPLRQPLGELLLSAGRAKEAEQAFRQDLVRYPRNGWSLHGLARALEAQGRTGEARKVKAQFELVWEGADVTM